MILALLLAAQAMTPIEAERAFAGDAQKDGQWTAFRRWAADDAVMFDPQPVKTQVLLKDVKDPPKAIEWWPTASYVSCDGRLAVNTGGWKRPDGSVGYFTTIWQKQPGGGWKWIVDSGDTLAEPRPAVTEPVVRVANCTPLAPPLRQAPFGPQPTAMGEGRSPDNTLSWRWTTFATGARELEVSLHDGRRYVDVLRDRIPAPRTRP